MDVGQWELLQPVTDLMDDQEREFEAGEIML